MISSKKENCVEVGHAKLYFEQSHLRMRRVIYFGILTRNLTLAVLQMTLTRFMTLKVMTLPEALLWQKLIGFYIM